MIPKMRFVSAKQRRMRRLLRYFFPNRKVKDRLFCYIFERDKRALLQLYNALNNTDYSDESALQIVTLDNVLYMSMNNDVAFMLMGTLNLYEHQSTICPNLPLRFLLYAAAEYEAYVGQEQDRIYGSTLIKLPAPRCIAFYNGDTEMEDERILRLTDAFMEEPGEKKSCLELTVRVLNINHGYNQDLMAGCRRLAEYSCFVAKLKEYQKRYGSTKEAVDAAVSYCVEHGILTDILIPLSAEVKKMLLTEYNEKKVMAWLKKEAREEGRLEGQREGRIEGRQEGRIEGRQEGGNQKVISQVRKKAARGKSPEEIAEMLEEDVSRIRKICEMLKAHPQWSDEKICDELKVIKQ